MKVALVLTGHMRCWDQVFPNTKETILDRWDTDVFIHAWGDQAWWDPHSKEGFVANSPKIEIDGVKQHYNPVEMVFEDFEPYRAGFDKHAEKYENHFHVKRNILSMFYKLHKGVELVNDYSARTGTHYDMVIRMRPDMVFNQHLPEFDPNKFYTIRHRNHLGQGTGDMLQVSNPWLMSIFSNVPTILPIIYRETGVLCPHIVSEHFLKKMHFPWQEIEVNKHLMHTPKGEYVPKQNYGYQ
jgi:hypothetical protein